MENQTVVEPQVPSAPVGAAPAPVKSKKGANKWIFIFLGLLILGGAGIFFFATTGGQQTPSPTPSFGIIPNEEVTPAPSPTPSEPVDKSEVTVQILNGTGVAGEAGYLQGKLKELDYTNIEVGNADSTDYTDTVLSVSDKLSSVIVDELKKELDKIYTKVTIKTSSSQKYDAIITTGTREGAAKSTSTPKATTAASPTAEASASPTASPSN